MNLLEKFENYLKTKTDKTFKEFTHFPKSVPQHSIKTPEQASELWGFYGEGEDQGKWLSHHSSLLSPEVVENTSSESKVHNYYDNMQKLEEQWTVIYRTKDYNGPNTPAYEQLCREGIEDYLQIRNFKDDQMDYSTVPCDGAYRLFLLYERSGRFHDELMLARDVLEKKIFGQKFWKRLVKAAKKLKIELTDQDKKLIEMDQAVGEAIQKQREEENEKLKQENPGEPSYRMTLSQSQVDEDELTPASPQFTQRIINEFYSGYPVKPFICKDQEFNNSPSWEEQLKENPGMAIPKETMTPFSDGLLPGDVRLLYWIKNVHRKRIPGYFVYAYGISFPEEKEKLTQQGYIGPDGKVTEKGDKAISDHQEVWA